MFVQVLVGQHLARRLIEPGLPEHWHDPHRPTMVVLALHDRRLEDCEVPVGGIAREFLDAHGAVWHDRLGVPFAFVSVADRAIVVVEIAAGLEILGGEED